MLTQPQINLSIQTMKKQGVNPKEIWAWLQTQNNPNEIKPPQPMMEVPMEKLIGK